MCAQHPDFTERQGWFQTRLTFSWAHSRTHHPQTSSGRAGLGRGSPTNSGRSCRADSCTSPTTSYSHFRSAEEPSCSFLHRNEPLTPAWPLIRQDTQSLTEEDELLIICAGRHRSKLRQGALHKTREHPTRGSFSCSWYGTCFT